MSVSIVGIDKVELLEELWNNARTKQHNIMENITFDKEEAARSLSSYIYTFQYSLICCDLTGDVFTTCGYNRAYGDGAGEDVVAFILKKKINK